MAGQDQHSSADITIDELTGMSGIEQAEVIADHYASISSLYKPIQKEKFQDYKTKAPTSQSDPIKSEQNY